MSDFTDYIEAAIIDWMFGDTAFPATHSTLYVALHTADPTNSGEANEVAAGDYGRAATTANGDWTRTANEVENANDIEFGIATSNWGEITHFSLWDAETEGNALAQSALDASTTIDENDEIRFLAGALTAAVN